MDLVLNNLQWLNAIKPNKPNQTKPPSSGLKPLLLL